MESESVSRPFQQLRLANREVLGRNVNVRSVRGTPTVSIRVRHSDRLEAGLVARELVRIYEERRREIESRLGQRMREELRKAIQEKEAEVNECLMVLAEVERTMKKNIYVGGLQTLLHIPESKEHQFARQSLADAERVLRLLLEEQTHVGEAGSARSSEHEETGDFQVSLSRVSPNTLLSLAIGAAIGLLVSPLVGYTMMWLSKRRSGGTIL